ncbi:MULTISPECIES: hypothetical protein [Streptomyces]|uniref:DUF4229 domain-containing protein n=1 Tax=Streptomyces flaveolus TaxID=67297 RepID=A0ABV3A267_9ACTN|nr:MULTISPECIES: hypothetical protein [Streptomyces]KMS86881.1 hypothetical protein ACZ91_34345 [Streptomyces regensis]
MSANLSPGALPVVVLRVGSLLMLGATACLLALREPLWRLALLVGAIVNAVGWLRNLRERSTGVPVAPGEESDEDEEFESFAWEYGDLRDGGEANR